LLNFEIISLTLADLKVQELIQIPHEREYHIINSSAGHMIL
jgi:hypothetical protein